MASNQKVIEKSTFTECNFDQVFNRSTSNKSIFKQLKEYVRQAKKGKSLLVTILGSSKTEKTLILQGEKSSPGLLPNLVEELFMAQKSSK